MHAGTDNRGSKPPFAFLSRYIPLALIAILLIMLLPQLADRNPGVPKKEARPAPPVPLTLYRTAYARLDSLGNEGLRRFGAGDWNNAVRLLGEAHFHYSVMFREGFEGRYPEDLRFYLGLAQYYRGRFEEGIALIGEEAGDDPLQPKYSWYLALICLAEKDTLAARQHLERVARLGGRYAADADELLGRIDGE